MLNLTMDESQHALQISICFEDLEEEYDDLHLPMIRTALFVINSVLSIFAVLGNTLILVALHKESSFHPPSKLLFRCLASTDLCVGLVTQPIFATYQLSLANERWNLCRVTEALCYSISSVLCGVSLATLTAISFDRLLALVLGLRYRQVVTLNRIRVVIIYFGLQSIAVGMLVFGDKITYYIVSYAAVLLCIVISTFCYIKIYVTLRRKAIQVQHGVHQGQPNGSTPLNVARYRKTVSSALSVYLVLVASYLPYAIAVAVMTSRGRTPRILLVEVIAATIVYLNSSLNPVFYCWKIKGVRKEVKEIIKKLTCPSN